MSDLTVTEVSVSFYMKPFYLKIDWKTELVVDGLVVRTS